MADVLHCPRKCHGIVVTHCALPGCDWKVCSVCCYFGTVDGKWLEPIRSSQAKPAQP